MSCDVMDKHCAADLGVDPDVFVRLKPPATPTLRAIADTGADTFVSGNCATFGASLQRCHRFRAERTGKVSLWDGPAISAA